MLIFCIQPGTLSPSTVSVPADASTFCTVPRKTCSLFFFNSGVGISSELDLDGAWESGVLGGVPPDCHSSNGAMPALNSATALERSAHPKTVEEIRNARMARLIWVTPCWDIYHVARI